MKKQTKVVLGILVAVVVVIIAVSVFYSPVAGDKSSGTFAKADKFQKSQMSEKDVQLRSELTSDTAKLRTTLQGLLYFAAFTEDLCLRIDTCVNLFQEKGMKSDDPGFEQLMALRDYAGFVRNNNETLGKTIGMLSSFYFSDNKDQSVDVEKNMREFSNYVKLFTEKDAVLESSLQGMDNFMLSNKILQDRKEELRKLKAIRDQLLIKGIQVAGLVQDKGLGTRLCGQALNTGFTANEKLQAGSQEKLQGQIAAGLSLHSMDYAQEKLGMVLAADKVGVTVSSNVQMGVVYDKANLQFVVGNASQLAVAFGATVNSQQVIGVVLFGTPGLNIVNSNIDLKIAFTGTGMGSFMNSFMNSHLNSLLNASQLGSLLNSQGSMGSTDYCQAMTGMVSGFVINAW